MKYTFEYDEIINCFDCPLCYDFIFCQIKGERNIDCTGLFDEKYKPKNCPLIEDSKETSISNSHAYELTFPISNGQELHGTDCPAEKCSVCGELFEEGANYCSWCGRRVIRNA